MISYPRARHGIGAIVRIVSSLQKTARFSLSSLLCANHAPGLRVLDSCTHQRPQCWASQACRTPYPRGPHSKLPAAQRLRRRRFAPTTRPGPPGRGAPVPRLSSLSHCHRLGLLPCPGRRPLPAAASGNRHLAECPVICSVAAGLSEAAELGTLTLGYGAGNARSASASQLCLSLQSRHRPPRRH